MTSFKQRDRKLIPTQEVLLKVEITANIASLLPNLAICEVI